MQRGGESRFLEGEKGMQVSWIKSTTGTWLPLMAVDLSNVNTFGVYMIWHGGNPARVVRLGQGDIRSRLNAHRNDRTITAYGQHGTLMVTLAAVPAGQADGVERYLANTWPPLVGDAFPHALPIAVNSPW